MLLPPQFKEEPLKTLGPPIRKEQENKPVEVEVSPGIWRVNGKLETRFPAPVLPMPVVIDYATIQTEVSEVDIPLPEFKVGDMVRIVGGGSREGNVGIIVKVPGDYLPRTNRTMMFYCILVDGRWFVSCDRHDIERA